MPEDQSELKKSVEQQGSVSQQNSTGASGTHPGMQNQPGPKMKKMVGVL